MMVMICRRPSAPGLLAELGRTSWTKRASTPTTARIANCAAGGNSVSAELMTHRVSVALSIHHVLTSVTNAWTHGTAAMNVIRNLLLHLRLMVVDVAVDADGAVAAVRVVVYERVLIMGRILTMRCISISGKLLAVAPFVHRYPHIAMLLIVTTLPALQSQVYEQTRATTATMLTQLPPRE